jgi:S-adenosyl-L-methionine hydrolase (adenosine-forming)
MPRPIVTLTTDFGLSDHFVGAMKGMILGICPQAQIVDISHGVTPFAIPEGAYLVAQAYRCFPKKTVHVVVVDPGVGSARRAVVAEAAGQFFVAPDNGVLSMIYAGEKHRVRGLTNPRYFRQPVSQTFHGRDIFAPVAAHLAAGVSAARMGKPLRGYIQLEFAKPARTGARAWTGCVVHADRFGNLITNFCATDFPAMADGAFSLVLGAHRVIRLSRNYAESAPGELFVIAGSSGYLEVSVNQDSAARITGCSVGAKVELVT